MSYFSLALATALDATGISQAEVCASTGIGSSAMSKYVSGALKAGGEVAGKIIRCMPAAQQPELTAAFVRDQTPGDLLELVEISPRAARLREAAPDPVPSRDILSGKHRELIGYFARRIHDPAIYAMLDASRRALEA